MNNYGLIQKILQFDCRCLRRTADELLEGCDYLDHNSLAKLFFGLGKSLLKKLRDLNKDVLRFFPWCLGFWREVFGIWGFFLDASDFGGKSLAFEIFSSMPRIWREVFGIWDFFLGAWILAGSFWHLRFFPQCLGFWREVFGSLRFFWGVFWFFSCCIGIHVNPVCRFQYQAECSWQKPGIWPGRVGLKDVYIWDEWNLMLDDN